VRLWVDDRLIVDQWQDQVATYDADVSLTQGYHWVRLEYYDGGGPAVVGLNWAALRDPPRSLRRWPLRAVHRDP
jgi:hypothetical protein